MLSSTPQKASWHSVKASGYCIDASGSSMEASRYSWELFGIPWTSLVFHRKSLGIQPELVEFQSLTTVAHNTELSAKIPSDVEEVFPMSSIDVVAGIDARDAIETCSVSVNQNVISVGIAPELLAAHSVDPIWANAQERASVSRIGPMRVLTRSDRKRRLDFAEEDCVNYVPKPMEADIPEYYGPCDRLRPDLQKQDISTVEPTLSDFPSWLALLHQGPGW